MLIAAGLLSRPGKPLRNSAVLLGSFVPDLAIYCLFFWSKIAAIPEGRVWNVLYWQEPWQTYTALGNSLPLYLVLLLVALLILRAVPNAFRIGVFLFFLSLAAITHLAGDFPVHVTDAHRHFWPISDWKFTSSISYWNPSHHGDVFFIFEALGGFCLAAILFIRFRNLLVRLLLVFVMLAYVAVPLYFSITHGGH